MYRSALVALNPDRSNHVLLTYAVELARKYPLRLNGIAIIDKDLVAPAESVPLGAGAFKVMRDEALIARTRERIGQALAEFTQRCQQAGVEYDSVSCEDHLACEIAQAVQRCDVLLVGHTAGTEASDHPSERSSLHEILKHCPRPALVVPAIPSADQSVVVAYDGSVQSARALEAFVASGLMADCPVHVVSLDADLNTAERWAGIAVDYLRSHGYHVEGGAQSASKPAAEAILQAVRDHSAKLLVMGAYGKPAIREFFFGSVTRAILRAAAVPIFLDH